MIIEVVIGLYVGLLGIASYGIASYSVSRQENIEKLSRQIS